MADLDWLRGRVALLDAKLRPIATRPIRFEELASRAWLDRDPIEEVGERSEADALLRELIDGYQREDGEMRAAVRALLADHPSFTWAVTLPWRPVTHERLRDHLLLFSMKDQERDTRDAMLLLQALCHDARAAGIDMGPSLKEVAALSSEADRYGWGSTRDLLLRAIPVGRP